MKFTAAFITCLVGFAAAAPQVQPGKNGTHAEWNVSEVTAETVEGIISNTHYSLTLKAGDATAKCNAASPIRRESSKTDKLDPLPKTPCEPKTFEFSWEPVGKHNGTHQHAGQNGTHPKTGKDSEEDKEKKGGFVLRLFDTKTEQVAKHHIPADQVKPKPGPKETQTGVLPISVGYVYDGPKTFKVVPKKVKGKN